MTLVWTVRRLRLCALIVAVLALPASLEALTQGQPVGRVQVIRPAVVMEGPRGDSVVLGTVPPGTVLEGLQQSGRWIEVTAEPGSTGFPWRRGWINVEDLTLVDPAVTPARSSTRGGEFMIRAFGHYGGTRFNADNSFDAVFGSAWAQAYGGGAQVVFGNGLFVQAGVDFIEETGTRAIVSDEQIFRTSVPDTVSITPILATVGFRDPRPGRLTAYVGAGVGWHVLKEESPALETTASYEEGHFGYHFVGGAELGLFSWLWLAGEAQWAGVPDGLGETGIGPAFDETDLGGVTFRVKLIIGR